MAQYINSVGNLINLQPSLIEVGTIAVSCLQNSSGLITPARFQVIDKKNWGAGLVTVIDIDDWTGNIDISISNLYVCPPQFYCFPAKYDALYLADVIPPSHMNTWSQHCTDSLKAQVLCRVLHGMVYRENGKLTFFRPNDPSNPGQLLALSMLEYGMAYILPSFAGFPQLTNRSVNAVNLNAYSNTGSDTVVGTVHESNTTTFMPDIKAQIHEYENLQRPEYPSPHEAKVVRKTETAVHSTSLPPSNFRACASSAAPGYADKCTVCFIEKGPWKFSIKLKCQDRHREALNTLINEIVENNRFEPLSKNKLQGLPVLCKSEIFGLYCRGLVVGSPAEGAVPVFFIDYGSQETVPVTRLTGMPAGLREIPVLSMRCRLQGLGTKSPNTELSKNFKELVMDRVLTMRVCKQAADLLVEVYLEVDSVPVLNIINNQVYDQLSVASGLPVAISHYNPEIEMVYIQISGNVEQLSAMQMKVQDSGNTGQLLKNPYYGQPCLALYSVDNLWYRSVIIGIKGESYKVRFIDYGNEEQGLKRNALREIDPSLICYLPAQAVPCILAEFEDRNGKLDFQLNWAELEECVVTVTELLDVFLGGMKGRVPRVNLSVQDASIIRHSTPRHVIRQVPCSSEASVLDPRVAATVNGAKSVAGSEHEIQILPDWLKVCNIVHGESPANFYVNLLECDKKLEAISSYLKERFFTSPQIQFSEFRNGLLVCLPSSGSLEEIHRAVVLQSLYHSIRVRMIDTGVEQVAKKSEVRSLPPEVRLEKFPPQAIHCRVSGQQRTYTDREQEIFKASFIGQQVNVHFISKEDDIWKVDILKTSNFLEEIEFLSKPEEKIPVTPKRTFTLDGSPVGAFAKATFTDNKESGVPGSDRMKSNNLLFCKENTWRDQKQIESSAKEKFTGAHEKSSDFGSKDKRSPEHYQDNHVRHGKSGWTERRSNGSPSGSWRQHDISSTKTKNAHSPTETHWRKQKEDTIQEESFDTPDWTQHKGSVAYVERNELESLSECNKPQTPLPADKTGSPPEGSQSRHYSSLPSQPLLQLNDAVYVSFVECATNSLWLQRTLDTDILETINRNIEIEVLENRLLQKVSVDSLCLCQSNIDNLWYRARILSFKNKIVVVHYIDYGNSEELSVTQLQDIPFKLIKVPQLSYSCSLETNEVVPSISSIEDEEEVMIIVTSKKVGEIYRISLRYESSPPVSSVTAEKMELPVEESNSTSIASDDHNNETVTVLPGTERYSGELKPTVISPSFGVELEMLICHVADDGSVWVQLCEFGSRLDDVMDKLAILEHENNKLDSYDVGKFCAGRYSLDMGWYRSQILFANVENEQAHVQYIDYGNTEVLSFHDLKPLPADCMDLPSQAIHCFIFSEQLSSVITSTKLQHMEWLSEASISGVLVADPSLGYVLTNISLEGVSLDQKIISELGDVEEKDLPEKCDSNISESNIPQKTPSPDDYGGASDNDDNFATDSSASSEVGPPCLSKDQLPEVKDELPQIEIPHFEVPSTDSQNILFTYVENDSSVWIQLLKNGQQLDRLMDDISSFVRQEAASTLSFFQICPGKYCLCKYAEDGEIYRAQILDSSTDNAIKVHFIDYGNSDTYKLEEMNEIYALPETFASLPQQALHCTLDISKHNIDSDLLMDILYEIQTKNSVTGCISTEGDKHIMSCVTVGGQPLVEFINAKLAAEERVLCSDSDVWNSESEVSVVAVAEQVKEVAEAMELLSQSSEEFEEVTPEIFYEGKNTKSELKVKELVYTESAFEKIDGVELEAEEKDSYKGKQELNQVEMEVDEKESYKEEQELDDVGPDGEEKDLYEVEEVGKVLPKFEEKKSYEVDQELDDVKSEPEEKESYEGEQEPCDVKLEPEEKESYEGEQELYDVKSESEEKESYEGEQEPYDVKSEPKEKEESYEREQEPYDVKSESEEKESYEGEQELYSVKSEPEEQESHEGEQELYDVRSEPQEKESYEGEPDLYDVKSESKEKESYEGEQALDDVASEFKVRESYEGEKKEIYERDQNFEEKESYEVEQKLHNAEPKLEGKDSYEGEQELDDVKPNFKEKKSYEDEQELNDVGPEGEEKEAYEIEDELGEVLPEVEEKELCEGKQELDYVEAEFEVKESCEGEQELDVVEAEFEDKTSYEEEQELDVVEPEHEDKKYEGEQELDDVEPEFEEKASDDVKPESEERELDNVNKEFQVKTSINVQPVLEEKKSGTIEPEYEENVSFESEEAVKANDESEFKGKDSDDTEQEFKGKESDDIEPELKGNKSDDIEPELLENESDFIEPEFKGKDSDVIKSETEDKIFYNVKQECEHNIEPEFKDKESDESEELISGNLESFSEAYTDSDQFTVSNDFLEQLEKAADVVKSAFEASYDNPGPTGKTHFIDESIVEPQIFDFEARCDEHVDPVVNDYNAASALKIAEDVSRYIIEAASGEVRKTESITNPSCSGHQRNYLRDSSKRLFTQPTASQQLSQTEFSEDKPNCSADNKVATFESLGQNYSSAAVHNIQQTGKKFSDRVARRDEAKQQELTSNTESAVAVVLEVELAPSQDACGLSEAQVQVFVDQSFYKPTITGIENASVKEELASEIEGSFTYQEKGKFPMSNRETEKDTSLEPKETEDYELGKFPTEKLIAVHKESVVSMALEPPECGTYPVVEQTWKSSSESSSVHRVVHPEQIKGSVDASSPISLLEETTNMANGAVVCQQRSKCTDALQKSVMEGVAENLPLTQHFVPATVDLSARLDDTFIVDNNDLKETDPCENFDAEYLSTVSSSPKSKAVVTDYSSFDIKSLEASSNESIANVEQGELNRLTAKYYEAIEEEELDPETCISLSELGKCITDELIVGTDTTQSFELLEEAVNLGTALETSFIIISEAANPEIEKDKVNVLSKPHASNIPPEHSNVMTGELLHYEPVIGTPKEEDEGEDFQTNESNEGEDFQTNESNGEDFQTNDSNEGEDFQTGESNEGEDSQTGESNEGEDFQTGESNEGEDFQTIESNEGEDFQTGESNEGEDFQTNESNVGEDFQTNESNKRGEADSLNAEHSEEAKISSMQAEEPHLGKSSLHYGEINYLPEGRKSCDKDSLGVDDNSESDGSILETSRNESDTNDTDSFSSQSSKMNENVFLMYLMNVEEDPFSVWFADCGDAVNKINGILNEETERGLKSLDQISIGMICSSYFCGSLLRARVLSCNDTSATVRFVDIGKKATFSLQSLFQCPSSLTSVPFQASRYSLPLHLTEHEVAEATSLLNRHILKTPCACVDITAFVRQSVRCGNVRYIILVSEVGSVTSFLTAKGLGIPFTYKELTHPDLVNELIIVAEKYFRKFLKDS